MTVPIQVLLVEDSLAVAQLTLEALRDALVPNRIHLVVDGEEALRFLHREPPHFDAPRPNLILLDLNLPKVDEYFIAIRMLKELWFKVMTLPRRAKAESAQIPWDLETIRD